MTKQTETQEPQALSQTPSENVGITHSSGYDTHGVATANPVFRIRRLTPKECWRLQGFPDELFEKARAVNPESQLRKQAGNAVTVNVAYAVAKALPELHI